jgi:DNA polymerase III delta prime subunit
MTHNNTIPWVEKYRPTNFDDIVLDSYNKTIMESILRLNYFPNLLLYGPPGTGKTTTIINLVSSFQEKNDQKNKGLMIHLNASDDRGIDIIRSQINHFVNSKSFYNNGTKFVILDEVDYMTKNAQNALKYLIQGANNSVRFCLICNYISRIDESLQNEFVRLRFNQLPEKDINKFLFDICKKEQIKTTLSTISAISILYKSDIRSMINYIQSNQGNLNEQRVISHTTWGELTVLIKDPDRFMDTPKKIELISSEYNIDIKNIIKDYINYIIRYNINYVSSDFIKFVEFILHIPDAKIAHITQYFTLSLHELLNIK